MSMIECPECHKQISDKAAACPGCGAPRSRDLSATERVVTTQLTGKTQKGWQLVAVVIMALGIVLMFAAPYVGAAVTAVGVVIAIWTSVSAWWQYG